MKYFFAQEPNGKRHIVVANEIEDVATIFTNANLILEDVYELTPDVFDAPGFLISDK